MENKPQIITKYELCPNPQAIRFSTNWNTKNHPALKHIIDNIVGVEELQSYQWGLHKYNFLVIVGSVFDRDEVAKVILEKIDNYFSDAK